ncbi:MAG: hypothetical protein L0I24_20810, partial [Pseudonocardia sp.]|nr:hypothetical protein [Pseudonocardia sp.]
WAAALGTIPYLTLKALWLGGSTVGVTDPDFLAAPGVVAANAVTFALDLCVVVLALALTHAWGRRVPAWALLLPAWVGTGFLVPMAVVILPTTLAMPADTTWSEPWLHPLVYGGFAWQGVFLVAAFALHAHARWSSAVVAPTPGPTPLLHVIAAGGTAMAVLSAGLQLAVGDVVPLVVGGLTTAGAVGVLALVRGATAHRWLAAAAAWVGSAVMFSWGLYGTLLAHTGALPVEGLDPVAGLAQLTGLLGGFSLAVAALLALVGSATAVPDDTSAPRVHR